MSDIFDAIIVGAGPAGSTAAYVLAQAGLDTLIIERGNFAGSKNMTGGRLYAHTLENIIPGFADEAPVERCITREKISFLTENSAVTMDYQATEHDTPAAKSYSVLRATFDKWLLEKAEASGAQCISGIKVDSLLRKNGAICGVGAGGDELEARVVILAGGANSILAEQAGLDVKLNPQNYAVGVKELLEFSDTQMADRFGCVGNEGTAWLFAGTPSCGQMGGGFLYTNKNTVSLGLVFGLHHVDAVETSVPQMLENFKQHPAISPLVADGKLVEYSAHIVPEGGLGMVPKVYAPGVLVAGDAAGFCLNVGYTVRGMDLAIASGHAAAQTVLAAKERNDFSESALSAYQRFLDESIVAKDLHLYKAMPSFIDNPRFFSAYPTMLSNLMRDLFTVNGPAVPIRRKVMHHAGKVGFINIVKDGFKGMRAL